MKTFRANGKLLLSAEYTVLRGALALAVPTQYGQRLSVNALPQNELVWESYTVAQTLWFSVRFDANLSILETTDQEKAKHLKGLLLHAQKLNPNLVLAGNYVRTDLEFHRLWGLGSSSTLVALIARWAEVDAFQLFFETQQGSGYDVACALNNQPITYQLLGGTPLVNEVHFSPLFKDDLGFVYLKEKQISAKELISFASIKTSQKHIDAISEVTRALLTASTLPQFEQHLKRHEALTAAILNRQTIQEQRFSNYPGVVKSLGAWGGDFVLVTRFNEHKQYFLDAGYATCISWQHMLGIQKT